MGKILQDVIAGVESGHNQYALRFEPATFAEKPLWITGQVNTIMRANACDYDTALAIACTSYGFYQLLGANIYANGRFNACIFDYVETQGAQTMAFYDFIHARGFSPNENVSTWDEARFVTFAAFYNGPGDTANYIAAMKREAGL